MNKPKHPKKLTCRKINALLKDEAMASQEYKELSENSQGGFSVLLEEMSNDEKKHHQYLEKMKEIEKCPK